jgi:hypothetical protein
MSFSIGGSEIKRPKSISEMRVEQYAQQKTLDGTVSRDYFSSRVGTKRVWELSYDNVQPSDYNVIDAVYTTYKSTDTAQAWVSDETNYVVSATVHMDLVDRQFTQQGTDYLSAFTLILTEE